MREWLFSTYDVLLVLVGAGGMAVAGGRWAAPRVKALVASYRAAKALHAKMPLIEESHSILQRLDRYITPNGGSSLMDKVDSMGRDIRTTSQRLQVHIDLNTSNAVFEADKDGMCTFVNREWCDITGLLSFQAHGTGWILGVHPDDREAVRKAWREAITERHEFDMRFRYHDQTTQASVPVRCRAVPWYNGAEICGWTVAAKRDDCRIA